MTSTSRRRHPTVALLSLGLVASATVPSAQAARGGDTTGPVFQDGVSQKVFDADPSTWIRQELWVQVPFDSDRDGEPDRIHVSLARPKETATTGVRVPVILQDSPYFAGTLDTPMWDVNHPLGQPPTRRGSALPFTPRKTSPVISTGYENPWVSRGFAVAQMESPGSGHSGGCATTGASNESLAAKAVVEWFAGKGRAYTSRTGTERAPGAGWSNSNVAMTGTSYNGTLPIGAASTGVKNLKAIIPVAAISSWYGYYRSGGAVRAPGGYQGEDADVLADVVTSRPDREVCDSTLADLARRQDRATGDYSPFWDQRNYLKKMHKFHTPTLVVHGLGDRNVMPDQAINLFQQLKTQGVPHQMYLHSGGHANPLPDEMANRWLTRYLWKHKNNVEKMPKVNISSTSGGTGTSYPTWPVPGATKVTLRPTGDGNTIGALGRTTAPSGTTSRVIDDASLDTATAAAAASSPSRLTYAAPAAGKEVGLSGTPTVTVRASFRTARANVTAALVEYTADGKQRVLTRGWIDPRNVKSQSREIKLKPGKSYDLTVPLQPIHRTLPATSRLGLVIMQSDEDHTIRPEPGTPMDVSLTGTSVRVPMIGGSPYGS